MTLIPNVGRRENVYVHYRGIEPATNQTTKVSLDAPVLAFKNQAAGGATTTKTLTARNNGTVPVQITPVAITNSGQGAFSIASGDDQCSGKTINATQTCAITVTYYQALAWGPHAGILTFSSTDTDNPNLSVSLYGGLGVNIFLPMVSR